VCTPGFTPACGYKEPSYLQRDDNVDETGGLSSIIALRLSLDEVDPVKGDGPGAIWTPGFTPGYSQSAPHLQPTGTCAAQPENEVGEPQAINLDDAGVFLGSPTSAVARSKEGAIGCFVQNTFIHAAPPPLTPLPGALRRSMSLPSHSRKCQNEDQVLENPTILPSFPRVTQSLTLTTSPQTYTPYYPPSYVPDVPQCILRLADLLDEPPGAAFYGYPTLGR